MSTEGRPPQAEIKSSPLPGCLILATIVFVFGGLIVLYAVVGGYQKRKIAGFTQEAAATIEVMTPTPAQSEAALGKLKEIEKAVQEDQIVRVLFSVDDLNCLIATLDGLEDFRGQTWILELNDQGMIVVMAQPVRKGIVDKGLRYLNGKFTFEPELRARTVAFKMKDIDPAVGEIPRPFIDSYAVLDFFRLDPELDAMKKHIGSIAAVYVENGMLVVETGDPPGLEE